MEGKTMDGSAWRIIAIVPLILTGCGQSPRCGVITNVYNEKERWGESGYFTIYRGSDGLSEKLPGAWGKIGDSLCID